MYTDEHLRLIYNTPHFLSHICGKDRARQMHSEWIKYGWDTNEHRSLQAHRNSFKTTNLIEIGIIRWMLFHPNERIGLWRKTFSDAAKVVRTIENIMLKEEVRELFKYAHGDYPEFKIRQFGRLEFTFKHTSTPEGNIEAHGIGDSMTGSHYDKIITDDIITLKDRLSKAEREKTKEYINEITANIIEPGKGVLHVGTPWHKDDGWQILPEPKKFTVHDTGLFTEEDIERIKKNTKPALWAANYELAHISEEYRLFENPEYGRWEYNATDVMAHLDAAYDGNHYCALTIMGRKPDGKLQCVGWAFSGNVKNWLHFIISKLKQYRVSTIYNEDNPDKGYTADKLKSLGASVITYHEMGNKHHKISTNLYEYWPDIIFCESMIEEGKQDYKEFLMKTEYMKQIVEYEEGAEPDDSPDSAASLLSRHYKVRNNTNWIKSLSSF